MEMILLAAFIFLMALLYSSVGHGGASGYLAAMTLFNLAPGVMRPSVLCLNVIVAGVAAVRFYGAGWFSWRLFLSFAATSIPFAYLGGSLRLPEIYYRQIVGAVLLCAAYRLWRFAAQSEAKEEMREVQVGVALLCGAVLGLLSGLVGVGGGIFLSPLILLMRWADVRQASGVAAWFIVVNSIAGLMGSRTEIAMLPPSIFAWGAAALTGGIIGAELGSRRLANKQMRRALAVVLVIASAKLLLT